MKGKLVIGGIVVMIMAAIIMIILISLKIEVNSDSVKAVGETVTPRIYKKCVCENCRILFNQTWLAAENETGDDFRYYYNIIKDNKLLKDSGIKIELYLGDNHIVYKFICGEREQTSESVSTDVDMIDEVVKFFNL